MTADVALVQGGRQLWQEGLLLDYTIEVEDQEFRVHKFVMASVSHYFKVMLTGGMVESQADRAKLKGFNAAVVSDIIQFIYTNQLVDKSIADLKDLLACSVYLQTPAAIKKCTDDLCQKLDGKNCFDMLSVFKSYSEANGIKFTRNYIKSNINSILKSCKLDDLSYDDLLDLIDCWEKPEWDLFLKIQEWICTIPESRKAHANDLMKRVRFCLMSPAQVESVQKSVLFCVSHGAWCDLVENAVMYHKLPLNLKVLEESEQSRVRSDLTPVSFQAGFRRPEELHSLDGNMKWQKHDTLNAPPFIGWPCVVVVNNFLIVVDDPAGQCFVFDPRTLSWTFMEGLETEKHDFALVYHDKHLYAFGGEQMLPDDEEDDNGDVIERYSFRTDGWEVLDSKMPVTLLNHKAFSISTSIYVLGGKRSMDAEEWSARVDCFHPASGTWETKAPMSESEMDRTYGFQLMKLFGESIITVLDDEFTLQYYKPSTNQWSVWRNVGAGLSKLEEDEDRLDANKVVAQGDTLYLLNFNPLSPQGSGHCEKWMFSEKGLEGIVSVPEFPFNAEVVPVFALEAKATYTVLLAVGHNSVKDLHPQGAGDGEGTLVEEEADSGPD